MNARNFIIELPETVRDEIQRLHYEYSHKRDIFAYMIANNYDITSQTFKDYEAECEKAFIAYEAGKEAMQAAYIIPVVGDQSVTWTVDFDNSCVSVIANA